MPRLQGCEYIYTLFETLIFLSDNTVAQRGIQLVFRFVNFLALGDSLVTIEVEKWVSTILKEF